MKNAMSFLAVGLLSITVLTPAFAAIAPKGDEGTRNFIVAPKGDEGTGTGNFIAPKGDEGRGTGNFAPKGDEGSDRLV